GAFARRDAATTWPAANTGLSNTDVHALAIDPINASRVYAGTSGGGVFVDTFSVGSCNSQTLCLAGGRFQVQVTWNDGGQIRTGQATPVTPNSGSFWFLTADNLELTVKVLDGRTVNGKWWVFLGALSNIEYTVLVTDTLTLSTRSYFNPSGHLASVADTSAF